MTSNSIVLVFVYVWLNLKHLQWLYLLLELVFTSQQRELISS
jgi:hypothetical protein